MQTEGDKPQKKHGLKSRFSNREKMGHLALKR